MERENIENVLSLRWAADSEVRGNITNFYYYYIMIRREDESTADLAPG